MCVLEQATYTCTVCSATVLTRKNFCILVVGLSFLKKAPLLCYVVQNLLVAVMRTLPQITMPPDSLTHHVAMCVVPLATYVQCQMKCNAHISHCIQFAMNVCSATSKKERTRGYGKEKKSY